MDTLKTAQTEQFQVTKHTPSRSEKVVLFIILLTFLLIGLAQSRLIDLKFWQDHVMFIDPAANLYFGNGFTSSAWFAETKDKFWAGYSPLYSFLLYLWIKLFGFGIHTARSFNCFLATTCAVILWQAVVRLKLIISSKNRLFLITLVLLQLGYIINKEQGRPDVLMASFAIAALLTYSVQFTKLRYLLLSCLCILFPFAGLALVAYTVVLCSLLLIYLRKSFWKEFIFITIGLFLGFICIYILYSVNGVWYDFINSIIKNPTVALISERAKIGGFFGNRIFQILVILCFTLAIYKVIKAQFNWLSVLSFGLVAIFWIPLGMRLAGAFQFSYSWMVVIPLAICVFSSLDDFLRKALARRLSFPILGTILTLCLIISPYLNFVDTLLHWSSPNYSLIEEFVEKNIKLKNIKETDWIFSDNISYFAVKEKIRIVITKPYLNIIQFQEIKNVSVLIVRPKELSLLQDKLGGKWHKHGESITIKYKKQFAELGIYRRE